MENDDLTRLRKKLLDFRARFEVGFSPDTALSGWQSAVPSAGHCAAVAAIVWETLGGSLVSTNIGGISHWFNRVRIDDQLLDFDLTGGHFGYPAVQIKPAEELYLHTRERPPNELNGKTLHRATLLARRSGLLKAAEAVEKRQREVVRQSQEWTPAG